MREKLVGGNTEPGKPPRNPAPVALLVIIFIPVSFIVLIAVLDLVRLPDNVSFSIIILYPFVTPFLAYYKYSKNIKKSIKIALLSVIVTVMWFIFVLSKSDFMYMK